MLTAKLTDAVSSLAALTSLGIYIDVYEDDIQRPLLPGSAAALTGIRQLDINDDTMPPEILPALTGTHTLMLSHARELMHVQVPGNWQVRPLARIVMCEWQAQHSIC